MTLDRNGKSGYPFVMNARRCFHVLLYASAMLLFSGCGGDPESGAADEPSTGDSPESRPAANSDSPSGAGSGEKYKFLPHRIPEGKTVRLTSRTEGSEGVLRVRGVEANRTGRITIQRALFIDFISQKSDVVENPPIIVKVRENSAQSTVDWKEELREFGRKSSLVEIPLLATKNEFGWLIAAEEGTPGEEQAREIDEIVAFQNRNYLPESPVAVGESWDFDPSFLSLLVGNDHSSEALSGSMILRSVETDPDRGMKVATIGVGIRGRAIEGEDDDSNEEAAVALDGTLEIEMDTFLDRKLHLTGRLRSRIKSASGTLFGNLPVEITVEKKILP